MRRELSSKILSAIRPLFFGLVPTLPPRIHKIRFGTQPTITHYWMKIKIVKKEEKNKEKSFKTTKLGSYRSIGINSWIGLTILGLLLSYFHPLSPNWSIGYYVLATKKEHASRLRRKSGHNEREKAIYMKQSSNLWTVYFITITPQLYVHLWPNICDILLTWSTKW